ncbi:exported protein of unknown function [Hyphomicrobium sp. MC1]|nr:exported protein of unknown function [Hyphomicrobium sp. MC1]
MLLATNAALLAGGAPAFDGAASARICPVRMQRLAGLCISEAVRQPRTGRTDVGILAGNIGEVSSIEASMGGCVGCVRLGHGDREADLFTRNDQ